MSSREFWEDLNYELVLLRKGKGFTVERVKKLRTFTFLLGENLDFVNLKLRFVAAISALPDKELSELLLAIYGLSEGYENLVNLSARRETFSRKIGGLSDDTLNARERSAIDDLTTIIVNHYDNRTDLAANTIVPEYSRITIFHSILTEVENCAFAKQTQELRILPLRDQLDSAAPVYGFSTPSLTEIKPLFGIREVSSTFTDRGSFHKFYLSELLKRGVENHFAFEEIPRKSQSKQPNFNPEYFDHERQSYSGSNISIPTRELEVEVKFYEKFPSEIWKYKNKTKVEIPGTLTDETKLILSNEHSVRANFLDLFVGYGSGVAWKW